MGGIGGMCASTCTYRRSGFNYEYIPTNCELRVFLRFAINGSRFANINVHVYYSTVRDRPSQLSDSQFGLT